MAGYRAGSDRTRNGTIDGPEGRAAIPIPVPIGDIGPRGVVANRHGTLARGMDASPIGTSSRRPATRRSARPGRPRRPRPLRLRPTRSRPAQAFLDRVHDRHRELTDGEVATLHPGARRGGSGLVRDRARDRRRRGVRGRRQRAPFTIQSISKPLTYGLVLDDLGEAAVRRRIGVEPTGDAFNAITLAPGTRHAAQPDGQRRRDRGRVAGRAGRRTRRALDRIVALFGPLRRPAARRSTTSSTSPSATPAIATGRSRTCSAATGAIADDPDAVARAVLQPSARSRSTRRDLALIAATLANGGGNPLTGERVAVRRRPSGRC